MWQRRRMLLAMKAIVARRMRGVRERKRGEQGGREIQERRWQDKSRGLKCWQDGGEGGGL
jgi:hypothetical protein